MNKWEKTLLIATAGMLLVIVVELGAIWWEVRTTNRDQLKSAYAALPEARLDKMTDPQKRAYQSTLREVAEDVSVSVTNEPLQVEISQ